MADCSSCGSAGSCSSKGTGTCPSELIAQQDRDIANNLKHIKHKLFVMSGKAGAIVAGFAYFSTQYSMSTFMGCPASCYKAGFSGMSISVPGVAFSIILPAIFVGRKLMQLGHRNGFLTLADYIADRYESKGLRTMQALLMILFLILRFMYKKEIFLKV